MLQQAKVLSLHVWRFNSHFCLLQHICAQCYTKVDTLHCVCVKSSYVCKAGRVHNVALSTVTMVEPGIIHVHNSTHNILHIGHNTNTDTNTDTNTNTNENTNTIGEPRIIMCTAQNTQYSSHLIILPSTNHQKKDTFGKGRVQTRLNIACMDQ